MLFNFNLLCFYAMEMGLSQCLSTYAFVETSMDFQEWEHSTKEEKQKGKLKLTNRHSYQEETKKNQHYPNEKMMEIHVEIVGFCLQIA